MKIGIVGPASRGVAWEEHLRPYQSVSEVIIAASLQDVGKVDACILIDESEEQLENLTQSVRSGFHSFLVSKLPSDTGQVEKIYHASEEANVVVQFSHWPTLAPASQWMAQKIQKPRLIQVVREISHTDFLERNFDLNNFWIDELAFCIRWIDGALHHVDVKKSELGVRNGGVIHLFLRFDSGATAGIFITTSSQQSRHKRVASDHSFILECDVLEQTVRAGQVDGNGHLFFEKKTFDATRAAEYAATHFLKAIQLNKPTPFNAYHLLKTLQIVDKIDKKIVV